MPTKPKLFEPNAITSEQVAEALDAVLDTVRESVALDSKSATVCTLNELRESMPDDAVRFVDVPLSVSVEQFEAALVELREIGLARKSLAVLEKARELLGHSEDEKATHRTAVGGSYVTRAEFDALVKVVGVVLGRAEIAHSRAGYADGNIRFQLERAERTSRMPAAQHAALKHIIKAFDGEMSAFHQAERDLARERAGY